MGVKQHANWACNRLEADYLSAYFDNAKTILLSISKNWHEVLKPKSGHCAPTGMWIARLCRRRGKEDVVKFMVCF